MSDLLNITLEAKARAIELERENAALRQQLTSVVGVVQRYQPAGSPPPGGELVLVEWLLRSMAQERDALAAALTQAKGQTRHITDGSEYDTCIDSCPACALEQKIDSIVSAHDAALTKPLVAAMARCSNAVKGLQEYFAGKQTETEVLPALEAAQGDIEAADKWLCERDAALVKPLVEAALVLSHIDGDGSPCWCAVRERDDHDDACMRMRAALAPYEEKPHAEQHPRDEG